MTTCPFTKRDCDGNCALYFRNPYDDQTSCSFRTLAVSSIEIKETLREIAENID